MEAVIPVDSNGGNGDGNNGHADNDAYVDNKEQGQKVF